MSLISIINVIIQNNINLHKLFTFPTSIHHYFAWILLNRNLKKIKNKDYCTGMLEGRTAIELTDW